MFLSAQLKREITIAGENFMKNNKLFTMVSSSNLNFNEHNKDLFLIK